MTIDNTNIPEVQRIIQELDPSKDVLWTAGCIDNNSSGLEIQYIKPINNVKTIGRIKSDDINKLIEEYGENIFLDIVGYEVTYTDGIYGLEVEVDVIVCEEEEEPKFKMPWFFLVIAGIFTTLATIIFFIFRLGKRK